MGYKIRGHLDLSPDSSKILSRFLLHKIVSVLFKFNFILSLTSSLNFTRLIIKLNIYKYDCMLHFYRCLDYDEENQSASSIRST